MAAVDSNRFTGSLFHPHVRLACTVVAHKDRPETGGGIGFRKRIDAFRKFASDMITDPVTVDNMCHMMVSLSIAE